MELLQLLARPQLVLGDSGWEQKVPEETSCLWCSAVSVEDEDVDEDQNQPEILN